MNDTYKRNFYTFRLQKLGRDYELELFQLYWLLAEHNCFEGLAWPERHYIDLNGVDDDQ